MLNLHLSENLRQPFTITNQQILEEYQNFYDQLLIYYQQSEFIKLSYLIEGILGSTSLLLYRVPSENDTNDLLVKIIKLLYQIFTIYPVKCFVAQSSAANFLLELFKIHKHIKGISLDWYPLYKIMKYFFLNAESHDILGLSLKVTSNGFDSQSSETQIFSTLIYLAERLSLYFPDEVIIGDKKTTTTEQLIEKLMPKISARGTYSAVYLELFDSLCPFQYHHYDLYFNAITKEIIDTVQFPSFQVHLKIINNTISQNLKDDFSHIVPTIFCLMNHYFIREQISSGSDYSILDDGSYFLTHQTNFSLHFATCSLLLYLSPKSRQTTLERLRSMFLTFIDVLHPSSAAINLPPIASFVNHIVSSLRRFMRVVTEKDRENCQFNIPEDIWFTDAELHDILSLVCELRILLIRKMVLKDIIQYIRIETMLDPLIIDRYYDYARQCIELMDAEFVANQGWTIITALVMSIDKNEKIRENFPSLFEIAANNLYRTELQLSLVRFFLAVFSKIPFNTEITTKGCENFEFGDLAYSFISNTFSIYRVLPAANGKLANMNPEASSLIFSCIQALIKFSSIDIKEKVNPLMVSLATDNEMVQSALFISPIVRYYCRSVPVNLSDAVLAAFEQQLMATYHDSNMFQYVSLIYSSISVSHAETIEDIKKPINLLLKFTKDEDKKFRKFAWQAIGGAHSFIKRNAYLGAFIKDNKDGTKRNPLEVAKFSEYDILWQKDIDISDYVMELYQPSFDILMTSTDPDEITKVLKEAGLGIRAALETTYECTEGQYKDDIMIGLSTTKLHAIHALYKKSVPLKETFMKCALRIIKDFRDHEKIIVRLLNLCSAFFHPISGLSVIATSERITLMQSLFPNIQYGKPYYNSLFIDFKMHLTYISRISQYVIPITDDIRSFFNELVQLGISNYASIRLAASSLMNQMSVYESILNTLIESIIDRAETIPVDEIIDFLTFVAVLEVIAGDDRLLCKTMLFLCANLQMKDSASLNKLKTITSLTSLSKLSFGTPHDNSPVYVDLLNKIADNWLNDESGTSTNRTVKITLISVIYMSLKKVYDVDDRIFKYIMNNLIHFDSDISAVACSALCIILRRRAKCTKTKIDVKSFPTIVQFPSILDIVKVKYPPDGIYIPDELKRGASEQNVSESIRMRRASSRKLRHSSEPDFSEDFFLSQINEQKFTDAGDEPNSDDELFDLMNELEEDDESYAKLEPEKSMPVDNVEENPNVVKIFKSFEKIEIEWNSSPSPDIPYDSEFFIDQSNGIYRYSSSFNRRTYEFTKNDDLLNSISSILASAQNGLNEDLDCSVSYIKVWKMYGLTLGPHCTSKLREICIKYLSDGYPSLVESVAYILTELIIGFMTAIIYWPISDRITFFKSVVLPTIYFIQLNPNTLEMANDAFADVLLNVSPYSIAPIYKILYDMTPIEPDPPPYSRAKLSLISDLVFLRPYQLYNIIDSISNRILVPFVDGISKYSMNMFSDLTFLLVYLFSSSSFSYESSPLYSKDIIPKRQSLIALTEKMIETKISDPQTKKKVIKTLYTFLGYVNAAGCDICAVITPIVVKHLHAIFTVLNMSDCQDEDTFQEAIQDFMISRIFTINTQLEKEFSRNFFIEIKNLALPMQLNLLDHFYDMISVNIHNIAKSDYPDYKKWILDYAKHLHSHNTGNEIKMKIAKIYGMLEIRDYTLDQCSLKNDDLFEIEIKAASIILNSSMFDKFDPKLTTAFQMLEDVVGTKRSPKRDFYKNIIEIFMKKHSGFVLPTVDEEIIQFRTMVSPDYIC